MTTLTAEPPLLYDVATTGQFLGCSRSRTFELIASGELVSIKVGRRRMVTATSITAYIEKLAAR